MGIGARVRRISTLVRYVREKLPGTHVVVPGLLPTGPKLEGVFNTAYPNKHSMVGQSDDRHCGQLLGMGKRALAQIASSFQDGPCSLSV
jgi:hypothetical protein